MTEALIRVPPSGPFVPVPSGGGGGFQSGRVAVPDIALSDGTPSPQSAVVTLATLAQAAQATKVTINGWGSLNMSADETGSPAPSDGTLALEVSWDGGATFTAASSARIWTGGGNQNPNTLPMPLFGASSSGPATGDVQCRVTFTGEPVGGSEGLTITLSSELAAVFA